MKYAVEMGPGAIIHTKSVVKIGEGDTQTHRQYGNRIKLFLLSVSSKLHPLGNLTFLYFCSIMPSDRLIL
jgi:hypothetical protein